MCDVSIRNSPLLHDQRRRVCDKLEINIDTNELAMCSFYLRMEGVSRARTAGWNFCCANKSTICGDVNPQEMYFLVRSAILISLARDRNGGNRRHQENLHGDGDIFRCELGTEIGWGAGRRRNVVQERPLQGEIMPHKGNGTFSRWDYSIALDFAWWLSNNEADR
jgi:hypothetical protein